MEVSIFCLVLFLSRVLSDRPMNVQVADHPKCIVNVPNSSITLFNESLEDKKKVIFFQIYYDSKEAEALTEPIPNDHFANPNEYMWLFDGEDGLPVYMNAPYDFQIYSLFILREYTSIFPVNMTVSESCNESILSRVEFLRLVFHQLIKIVSTAQLPDKRASDYVCYDVNNAKNIPESTFKFYKIWGMNQAIIMRYCCKVKDYHMDYNNSIDLCSGEKISTIDLNNLQIIEGLFLFGFFPLVIGFISWAKLNDHPCPFSLILSVSTSFESSKEYHPPFGTEPSWLNERDPYYSMLIFVRWLFLFEKRSYFASRIRRSLTVILCLVPISANLFLHNLSIKETLKSYLENNAPIGYKSMIFGFEKSVENTDYFLGGPFVWFSAFVILGLIVINIPDRLCETIAYSTLHQKETFTFLVQDIKLLQRYGSLNVSNLYDYDLLHAILRSSLWTALNPSFWCAVIKRWFNRWKRVYNYFNSLGIIYQLMCLCVTFSCVFILFLLCVCELLLSIVYYGCPILQIFKAIPHSYTQCYICPLYRHPDFKRKILGVICFLISFPVYIFLSIFFIYVFLTILHVLNAYIAYTTIALIAKPDAIAYVILFATFIYYLVSIAESISETYLSLQKLSIHLAQKVFNDFVYIRLEERFIYRELFKRIVQQHHPIRHEIAKALFKLSVGAYILVSCVYAFQSITMNMSAYIKIGLLIFALMIPKFMSVLQDTMLESRWKALPILETIYVFQQEQNFQQRLVSV